MTEKKKRIPVPQDVSAEVLFKSDMTCCKCRVPRLPIQIHHIDDDPSNNVESNLAVFCLICHDDTMVRGGFGRRLIEDVVRKYKADWERIVLKGRSSNPRPLPDSSPPEGVIHVASRWVDTFDFVVGQGSTPLEQRLSVEMINRDKVPRHISSLGFRIDPIEGEPRYAELHLILGLAHLRKIMEPGEKQMFSISITDLTSAPFHDGLKAGESISVFVMDTMGDSWYSKALQYSGE